MPGFSKSTDSFASSAMRLATCGAVRRAIQTGFAAMVESTSLAALVATARSHHGKALRRTDNPLARGPTFAARCAHVTTIKQEDFIASIADALQYISYYHPVDYIEALAEAYAAEQSPAAKDAIAQILTNSRMCAEGHRPICQDTGIVNVFLKVGMDVRFEATLSVVDMCSAGVRRAYTHPDNTLRGSVLADPLFTRKNTKDNSPAVVNVELVPGNTVDV